MKDQDKIKIEIHIAGEPIGLTVPFKDQDLTRDIEEEINTLFGQWRRSFPKQTDKGLLAMMLYRYASYYKNLTMKYQEASNFARECLEDAEDMLKP